MPGARSSLFADSDRNFSVSHALPGCGRLVGRIARYEYEAKHMIGDIYDCLLQIYRDAIVQRRSDEAIQSVARKGISH